jgi:hypothetical protein
MNLFVNKNANLWASTWGDGWKFGAPHANVSSNPALCIAKFGHGEHQRLEVLLALAYFHHQHKTLNVKVR